jgi:hypothetical protein
MVSNRPEEPMRALILLPFLSSPALSGPILSEVTGNWAGASNQGFYFRAQMEDMGDHVALQIWNGMGAVPEATFDPAMRIETLMLRDNLIEPGEQRLELIPGSDTMTLLAVTESADEQAETREALTIRFMDNMFMATGYYWRITDYQAPDMSYECDADLASGKTMFGGLEEPGPALSFEDKNAALWSPTRIFELGYCPNPS